MVFRDAFAAMSRSMPFWVTLLFVSSSIEPIVVKIGYRGAAGPFHFLFIKAIVGALVMIPLTGRWSDFSLSKARRFIPVTILFIITTGLVLISLKYLSAVMVITIITSTPALVAIINQRRGREIVGVKFWIGFLLCLAGIVMTLETGGKGAQALNATGLAAVFASVVASALYRTRMDDLTNEFTPLTSSLYLFFLNGIIAGILCAPWALSIPSATIPLGIAIGVAGAVANVAFLTTLHLLGSTRISIISILQRPLVIIAVSLILKESLSIMQIAGIILVLAGIQTATVKKRHPSPAGDIIVKE